MRCSSRVTIYHLKRFLLQKLCIPALYDVRDYDVNGYNYVYRNMLQLDILCDDNILHKDSTFKFIWLSFWLKKVCAGELLVISCCNLFLFQEPPLLLQYKLKQRLG